MVMDRSKRIGSVPRRNADGASGRTGNALGPAHMGGNPAGRAQVRGQPTSASGQYRASGKRGDTHVMALSAVPDLQFTQGAPGSYDFSQHFYNGVNYTSTSVPSGMTLNASTGVLSGTPPAISAGDPILTVKDANGVALTASYSWAVVAP